jgi:histidyl-tRNA synthetase
MVSGKGMKTIIPTVKGARDFYPEEMATRNWLYQAIRQVSEQFGYQEYDGPFLEKIELYAAKSGDELVKEQAFVFQDRGGELITLRTELTPSLTRMVAQRQNELVLPLRWWSFGPFWRYEKPQKGRSREFFQWNIDLIGATSPEADAELISIIAYFFKSVGLTPEEVVIRVNNRRLMNQEMAGLGIPEELRKKVLQLIDRRDKMRLEEWEANALEIGLKPVQIEGLLNLLEDSSLWEKSDELQRLFIALDALGCRDYVHYDPQIIRGLDYYTGTVFEAWDFKKEFRAILGGGRYDNLVADVGGDPLPGIGFAMGDMVVSLVLKKYDRIPKFQYSPAPVLVTVFNDEYQPFSLEFAAHLRQAGIKVACYPDAVKLPKQLKFADRIGVPIVVIIGPDEQANQNVTIKNLVTRTQQTVARAQAIEVIMEMLASLPPS